MNKTRGEPTQGFRPFSLPSRTPPTRLMSSTTTTRLRVVSVSLLWMLMNQPGCLVFILCGVFFLGQTEVDFTHPRSGKQHLAPEKWLGLEDYTFAGLLLGCAGNFSWANSLLNFGRVNWSTQKPANENSEFFSCLPLEKVPMMLVGVDEFFLFWGARLAYFFRAAYGCWFHGVFFGAWSTQWKHRDTNVTSIFLACFFSMSILPQVCEAAGNWTERNWCVFSASENSSEKAWFANFSGGSSAAKVSAEEWFFEQKSHRVFRNLLSSCRGFRLAAWPFPGRFK